MLTRKQFSAIPALMAAPTVRQAAILANVSERTLYRWLAEDEDFKAALHMEEMSAIAQATRRLIGLQEQAIARFETVLNSPGKATDKLRAAHEILKFSNRMTENRDIEVRLSALERKK